MQLKALFGLGLIATGAAFAATMTLKQRNAEAGPDDPGLLFAGLDERINDVASIRIIKEGESVSLERSKDDPNEWTVSSIGGYPAKFEPIKRAIVRLANMEIRESKTNKPENYEKLGVTDPEAEGSTSRLVSLADASGSELASVILGDSSYRGQNSMIYARRKGEDRVYLCQGKIDAQPTLRTWIETTALKLENDRVQSVTVTHADGETVQLDRSAENHTQFSVANIPPGRELKHEGVASGIASALSALSFDDVRPADQVDFQAEPIAQARYLCHDGLVLVVETARADDKIWARIQASYQAPPATESPEVTESPEATESPEVTEGETQVGEGAEEGEEGHEEGDGHEHAEEPPAESSPDPEVVRAEVEEMAAQHGPWAYALPSYKADAIAKRMLDLLNELPEETETGDAGAPGSETIAPTPEQLQELLKLGEGGVSSDDGDG